MPVRAWSSCGRASGYEPSYCRSRPSPHPHLFPRLDLIRMHRVRPGRRPHSARSPARGPGRRGCCGDEDAGLHLRFPFPPVCAPVSHLLPCALHGQPWGRRLQPRQQVWAVAPLRAMGVSASLGKGPCHTARPCGLFRRCRPPGAPRQACEGLGEGRALPRRSLSDPSLRWGVRKPRMRRRRAGILGGARALFGSSSARERHY